MTAAPDLVSIIMPAYRVERFVAEAVASARAQTHPRFELIAVDDGSTDETPAILSRLAQEWRRDGLTMSLIRQENLGAAAARNAGLDAARGGYIAFLDADDRWRPELLAESVRRFESAPDLDLVFPLLRYIAESGAEIGVGSRARRARYGAADILARNPIHSATGVVLRADAARRVGRFDEMLEVCDDVDYWLRVAGARPAAVGSLGLALAEYRKRAGQITGDWRRIERDWARFLEKAIARDPARLRAVASEARARHKLYLSAIAYANDDFAASRRLVAAAWAEAPRRMAQERHAYARMGAGLASLLPAAAHARLRDGFNGLRRRLGLDLS